MTEHYAEGENFAIDLIGTMAVCRVWSRPDTDSATGARFAQRKIAIFRRLAREGHCGLLFDLRKAPSVTGPKTQAALAAMLVPWERACKPVALLLGPSPMQSLQMKRLVGDACLTVVEVFQAEDEAVAWLEKEMPAPSLHKSG